MIAIFGFVLFIPLGSHNYGAMVVVAILLVCVSFLVVALLPLEPVTEANARAAKRTLLVSRIAPALLVLALGVKLFVRLYVGAA